MNPLFSLQYQMIYKVCSVVFPGFWSSLYRIVDHVLMFYVVLPAAAVSREAHVFF